MRPKRIRKKEDRYISTREAAKMLGIDMPTGYQYFGWGVLTGEQHPIPHLRWIDKGSVIVLMKN
jgi:predicted DNA-binding transcriptional regulator AlpA